MPRNAEESFRPQPLTKLDKIGFDVHKLMSGREAAVIHRKQRERAHRDGNDVLGTPAALDSIFEQIAWGTSLHVICDSFRVNVTALLDYIHEDKDRLRRYQRARNASVDLYKNLAIDIAQQAATAEDDEGEKLSTNDRRLLINAVNELAESRRTVEIEEKNSMTATVRWEVPSVASLVAMHQQVNEKLEHKKDVIEHDPSPS